MALKFERQVQRDSQGRVKYRQFRPGGREHYNLRVWLDGPDFELDDVKTVQYELHPTFRQRYRTSADRNDKFAISIWTWGMFAINATIHYKNDTKEETRFFLQYDLPEDDGTNYIKV